MASSNAHFDYIMFIEMHKWSFVSPNPESGRQSYAFRKIANKFMEQSGVKRA
jgi:hypothetical protein